MRPESLKRAGRRAALTIGAIAALSLFSFAPWRSDQHPAQAQDVLAQPKTENAAPVNPALLNLQTDKAKPIAQAPARNVQEPLPEPPPMIAVESFPELLVATTPTTPEQDGALMAAVQAYAPEGDTARARLDFPERAKPFIDFLAQYPSSGWAMAVHINLGLGYHRSGYYSRALASYEQAWALGKNSRINNEAKRLTDRAVGELLRMHARIGHMDEIDALLAEIRDRDIQGSASELVTGAKEGVWLMRNRPGIAFLCGPKALVNVLSRVGGTNAQILIAHSAESGPKGFSLTQLSELASKTGLKHRIIKREPGQPIPAPAIIHWKLNHYAAVVDEKDGRYMLDDPTFLAGAEAMTREAIDAEGSGYFIIPESAKPTGPGDAAGWRTVDPASDEAKAVFGMGAPSATSPDQTLCCEGKSPGVPCCNDQSPPMATAAGNTYLINLAVRDAPVNQRAAKGPSAAVTLNYNHREASQPTAGFKGSNVGFKWSLNWIAYLEDSPWASSYIYRYAGGGGKITYKNVGSSWAPKYQAEMLANGMIVRTPADFALPATSFEVQFPDGSKHVYGHIEHQNPGRKVWLTQVVDAQGNATTFSYTNLTGTQGSVNCTTVCPRLNSFTDATGKTTTFAYENASWPLRITKVTDHFGRYSALTYDGSGRIASITDPIGIVSSFAYGTGDFMSTLTTPYGDSTNAEGTSEVHGGVTYSLWLEMTDALGQKERFEYGNTVVPNDVTTFGDMKNVAHMPTGYPYPDFWNCCRVMRNSFHWDKHVTSLQTPGTWNYDQAMLRHYTHDAHVGANSVAAPILNSVLPPLQRRIFYAYQDAISSIWSGMPATPIYTGVVLDDGTSKVERATYRNAGQPDKPHPVETRTDALGRTTKFTYATGDIDLTKIEQQISATPTWATLAQFTYDANHNVLTATDAAGQVWRYAYNAAGQLIYATNPLNETRFWEYDASARLTRVTVPVAVAHASVVYGTTNLSAATAKSLNYTAACSGMTAPANTNLPISVTDSEGYIKCFEYDALDRIVKIKYPDGTTDLYDYNFPTGLSSQPTWTTGSVPTAGTPSLDVWRTTDRLGRVKDYVYDRNRQLIKASETVTVSGSPTTRTTQYAYYANGTLKELTDANGNVTRWDIDIQSRPTSKTYAYGTADAKTESYTYDIVGRLKTRTDARGQTLTYTLNKDDTLASYAFTNAVVATPGASFAYDAWYPRRTSMTDQFGTTTWTYKAVGTNGALLPLTENGPFVYDSMTQDYDVAGRLSSRTVSNTTAETFTYDLLGRVSTHASQVGSFTYTYLGQTGQVASRTGGGVVTNWGYDTNANDRRLLSISTTGAVARNFSYTANAYQITGITDTAPGTHPWLSQTWSFTHDASDRLLTGDGSIAGNHGYGYDKLDNALNFAGITGTYNGLNQISTFNAVSHTYDANGNLSSDGARTYTYDAADRLVTITQGGTTVTFAYDGLGRRLKQIVGATETRYLWCGPAICQQRSGAETLQKRFVAEGEYVQTGTKKYLTLTDHLGSVRDVIDITGTPTLVGSFDYRPYGEVARSWGTVTTGYTYAGLFAQTNTNLLLSTTRAYNPANGKWLNVDPIRERGGINLTGYVGAGPMAANDPLGLKFRFADGIDPGYIAAYLDAIEYLRNNSSIFRAIYDAVDKSPNWYTIGGWESYSKGNAYFPPLKRVYWNPKAAMWFCPGVDAQSPALALAHEIVHAWRHDRLGSLDDSKYPWWLEFWTGPEELAALKVEALIAWQLGESIRPIHRPGWFRPVPSPVPPLHKNEIK
ncbi:MAG: peptidase C39, bacteriocin processing [Acetobacteraceae bacterium]|nr:peptidase C39, bacteriocin processing [Acetobacteraceae bacterium]